MDKDQIIHQEIKTLLAKIRENNIKRRLRELEKYEITFYYEPKK